MNWKEFLSRIRTKEKPNENTAQETQMRIEGRYGRLQSDIGFKIMEIIEVKCDKKQLHIYRVKWGSHLMGPDGKLMRSVEETWDAVFDPSSEELTGIGNRKKFLLLPQEELLFWGTALYVKVSPINSDI